MENEIKVQNEFTMAISCKAILAVVVDYIDRRLQNTSPYSARGKPTKLEIQRINVSIVFT